jgi:hypothetical protein
MRRVASISSLVPPLLALHAYDVPPSTPSSPLVLETSTVPLPCHTQVMFVSVEYGDLSLLQLMTNTLHALPVLQVSIKVRARYSRPLPPS